MKTTNLIYFLLVFCLLGVIALNIPVAQIIGSSQNFTIFDYLGPSIGLFLGPLFGALSIFIVKLSDILIHQQIPDGLTLLRFLPMIMATIYIATKSKKNALVPLVCIVLFVIHPQGRQAWPYALYWLIPLAASFKKNRLLINSLGSTFTAHAVGSIIFLYAFNLPAAVWLSLIPIVAVERGLFALGIWVAYPFFNTILQLLEQRWSLPWLKGLINRKYTYSRHFFRHYA